MTSFETDEKAIRQLVQAWMEASRAGDTEKVLSLISDDAVFMVPGRAPFGKEAFSAKSQAMAGVRIEGQTDIQEIQVTGEWAWMRSHLTVTITPPDGQPVVRSGGTLTILRKMKNGQWVIARDANLLTVQPRQ